MPIYVHLKFMFLNLIESFILNLCAKLYQNPKFDRTPAQTPECRPPLWLTLPNERLKGKARYLQTVDCCTVLFLNPYARTCLLPTKNINKLEREKKKKFSFKRANHCYPMAMYLHSRAINLVLSPESMKNTQVLFPSTKFTISFYSQRSSLSLHV
jgi:hypothetical protein